MGAPDLVSNSPGKLELTREEHDRRCLIKKQGRFASMCADSTMIPGEENGRPPGVVSSSCMQVSEHAKRLRNLADGTEGVDQLLLGSCEFRDRVSR